ncbi:MAG: type II and III secretion system protein [Pseudohongiellaceae bacterium]
MSNSNSTTILMAAGFLLMALSACDTLPAPTAQSNFELENRHINSAEAPETSSDIPDIVRDLPVVTPPQPEQPLELYSVVVQDVPVRELLFAMARDADINIDVHSSIAGSVSINAIDQTLPQILQRIARQVDIRWEFEQDDYLVVESDLPILRSYRIDYVNVARTAESEVSVSSAVSSGVGDAAAGDANNSTTIMNQASTNQFWTTLQANLQTVLGGNVDEGGASPVIVNPETGLVTVRATARQHEEVYDFIESVRTRALYQVLIEATVVEVNLNDRFQSGVDWAMLARDGGQVSFAQDLTGLNLNNSPTNVLTIDKSAGPDAVNATISLLSQFGDTQVLSSPRLMALNNQTAMLRVVDSKIYFTIDVEQGFPGTATSPAIPPTFTSTVHTVPVGFTMAVTPQISESDQVTLNVRPTISRIIRFVNDPNPILAESEVVNAIPEIQIREIESILTVDSGEIAVLGGLMQDTVDSDVVGLPGLGRLPVVGDLFNYRDDNAIKTELIIFIRPVVVRQPSMSGDLQNYREFLPSSAGTGADTRRSTLR